MFIHWMYYNNLSIYDGIIYDNIEVCIKKYRCANSMWLLSVLAFTYIVIIYRCVNYTGHGRSKIDVINGYVKTYLKQNVCMIGTEEYNN